MTMKFRMKKYLAASFRKLASQSAHVWMASLVRDCNVRLVLGFLSVRKPRRFRWGLKVLTRSHRVRRGWCSRIQ